MGNKWRPEGWKYLTTCTKMGRKANKYFEKGADAMLEALRKRGKRSVSFMENGYWLTNPMIVDIPDDLQPVSNPDEFKPKEQLYICPKAKECNNHRLRHCEPHTRSTGCGSGCDYIDAVCIPYNPQPEKLYPPDTAYFIKKWQLHKATKVIENGYFCPRCFDQQPYTVGGFINYHRCPNNNMVLSGYD